MFQEPIAKITRDHAQAHLVEYLTLIDAQYADKVSLSLPKMFDTTSMVGGVVGVSRGTLPAFTLDCYDKVISDDNADLYTYLYSGRFMGVVGGQTAADVDRMAHRYSAALEYFVREHQHLTHDDDVPFLIAEFTFIHANTFGAAKTEEAGKPFWFDGFQVDVAWRVSENGPRQHE